MKRSEDRILTTHAGSLHTPRDLQELELARFREEPGIQGRYEERLASAVKEIVRKQADLGIDIVNDGEYSKTTWTGYGTDRIDGFELERVSKEKSVLGTLQAAKDQVDFADFYNEGPMMTNYFEPGPEAELTAAIGTGSRFVCTGPLKYNREIIDRDIANLKAALDGVEVSEVFLPVAAPGSMAPTLQDEYYNDEEALYGAVAEVLHEEYKAIVDAGFICQIDDAFLATEWDLRQQHNPGYTLKEFREWANMSVDALNQAIEGLPEDRLRYHVCWGSWNGPHASDIPLSDLVDLILKVNAQGYVLEAANARHEWEFRVWEDTKLPDGKILIPGVIEHTTNVVEHPQTVAERIIRFADIVGRENVIAGTDCGFRHRSHPHVATAKMKALGEGAAIASKKLWN